MISEQFGWAVAYTILTDGTRDLVPQEERMFEAATNHFPTIICNFTKQREFTLIIPAGDDSKIEKFLYAVKDEVLTVTVRMVGISSEREVVVSKYNGHLTGKWQ